jgi:hypothetical protein
MENTMGLRRHPRGEVTSMTAYPALDLRRLAQQLLQDGQHQGGRETAKDEEAVQAANRADADFAARQKQLIDWLQR